jgi:hypothetical protein
MKSTKLIPANKLTIALYGVTVCGAKVYQPSKNKSFTKKGPGREHQQGKRK